MFDFYDFYLRNITVTTAGSGNSRLPIPYRSRDGEGRPTLHFPRFIEHVQFLEIFSRHASALLSCFDHLDFYHFNLFRASDFGPPWRDVLKSRYGQECNIWEVQNIEFNPCKSACPGAMCLNQTVKSIRFYVLGSSY